MKPKAKSEIIYTLPVANPVVSCKNAKQTLLAVINVGKANGLKIWWQILIASIHGGMFIGLGGGLSSALAGSFGPMQLTGDVPVYDGSGVTTSAISMSLSLPSGVSRFVAGATFPIALFFIVLTGSELFTGNVMLLTGAIIANQITWKDWLRNLFISYFGNIFGTLTVAYVLFHTTRLFSEQDIQDYVLNNAMNMVYEGTFGMNVLKGVGDNYLIGIALWGSCASDDIVSKLCAMWWPVMAFVCIGFEHSIATSFYVPVAMMNDAPITTNDYISRCLIPVTIGNIIGGSIFIIIQHLMHMQNVPHVIEKPVHIVRDGRTYSEVIGPHRTAWVPVGHTSLSSPPSAVSEVSILQPECEASENVDESLLYSNSVVLDENDVHHQYIHHRHGKHNNGEAEPNLDERLSIPMRVSTNKSTNGRQQSHHHQQELDDNRNSRSSFEIGKDTGSASSSSMLWLQGHDIIDYQSQHTTVSTSEKDSHENAMMPSSASIGSSVYSPLLNKV